MPKKKYGVVLSAEERTVLTQLLADKVVEPGLAESRARETIPIRPSMAVGSIWPRLRSVSSVANAGGGGFPMRRLSNGRWQRIKRAAMPPRPRFPGASPCAPGPD